MARRNRRIPSLHGRALEELPHLAEARTPRRQEVDLSLPEHLPTELHVGEVCTGFHLKYADKRQLVNPAELSDVLHERGVKDGHRTCGRSDRATGSGRPR